MCSTLAGTSAEHYEVSQDGGDPGEALLRDRPLSRQAACHHLVAAAHIASN
jgi:hypothetical protein